MKKKAPRFYLSLFALLSSCASPAATSSNLSSDSSSSRGSSSESISSSSISSSSSSAASISSSRSKIDIEDADFDFYCVNDFHGAIVEQYNGSYYEAGISKYFGHLKALKEADPEHVVLLSAGDMYQGSLESNSNYGQLITECMNEAGFDAMTVGNHEFDYGQEKLLNNANSASFPFLGGNIVRYNDPDNTLWNEKIAPSTVLSRGGINIGVVGMIGQGQTTSINSPYVQDISFINPQSLAKAEAKRLREEEGCDLVIYVIHDETNSCSSYAANKAYFDGVFNAHTHQEEDSLISGVPFVQSVCNGEAYSHFRISITNGVPICTVHEVVYSDASWEEDETLSAIRDSYIEEESFKAKANEVAGTITNGYLYSKEGVPNLTVKAIFDKYKQLYPNLACAMENGQRASLYNTVTYHDIYKATPFMNKIVIASVTGRDIVSEASYNNVYSDHIWAYEANEYYQIACIDYVLYHQSVNKTYNYFSSLNYDFESKILAEHEDFPFDIAFNYIKNDLNGIVDASDYLSSAPGYGAYYAY